MQGAAHRRRSVGERRRCRSAPEPKQDACRILTAVLLSQSWHVDLKRLCASSILNGQTKGLFRLPQCRTTAFSSLVGGCWHLNPRSHVLNPGIYKEPAEFSLCEQGDNDLLGRGCADTVTSGPPLKAVFEVRAADVQIEGVTVEFKRSGILVFADDARIRDNRLLLASPVYRQTSCGIWLAGARRAQVSGNEFTQCGLAIAGPPTSDSSKGLPVLTGLFEVGEHTDFFTSHEITDNLVNGAPLFYAVNAVDVDVPKNAGQVILANCRDTTLPVSIHPGPASVLSLPIGGYQHRWRDSLPLWALRVYLCYTDGCLLRHHRGRRRPWTGSAGGRRNVVRNCTVTGCGQDLPQLGP